VSDLAPVPVFIHGAGGSAATWVKQEPRFEGAVILNLPGRAAGTAFEHVKESAAWVAEEIGQIDGPRALIGHSMGGQIAMELALTRPELVDGLVLITTGARIPVPPPVMEETARDFDARCDRFIRACYVNQNDENIPVLADQMRAVGCDTVLRDYTAVDGWDGRERLGQIRQPALVVAGAQDRITPPSMSEDLARGLANALPSIVPEAGHLVIIERYGAVNLLIAGFLARLELTLDGQ
jgi:pimeloyl-ACP methyl ester carboxylesterase